MAAREKPRFTCPVLEAEHVAQVSIPFPHIEDEDHGVKAILEEHGFAIVTDVLSSPELEGLEDSLQQDLTELMGSGATGPVAAALKVAQTKGVGSWPDASLRALGIKGRFQLHGLPQGRFAWGARLHPNVRRVYQILHETEDLVSSCDNSFAANKAAPEAADNDYWPHVDQNDHDKSIKAAAWEVYQGLLYVWSSEGTRASTTVVWPGSHKLYSSYMADPLLKKRGQKQSHFTAISMMQPGPEKERLDQGWRQYARRVPVPAGGLLLWSSRTTHQGWSGGPRLAQPVCWEPTERRDQRAYERKLALCALGLPSTHWASLGLPHHLVAPVKPTATPQETGSGPSGDGVVFPLRALVRSVGLVHGARAEEIWDHFAGQDLGKPLAVELVNLLERSVSQEFKAVL